MKNYKIYGAPYPLMPTTTEPPDGYSIKGELLDEPPKGKIIGYVTTADGSVIECYKKFPVVLMLLPLLLLLLGGGGFVAYLMFFQPKDVAFMGDIIKVGSDNNIVTYNGFPSIREGAASIQFTNGDYPATIKLEGKGIKSKTINVEPAQFVDSIPCEFTTDEGVVEATFTIQTETSTQSFPIVIEIPDNLNGNDNMEGLEGFWSGEQIYGPE